MLALRSLSVAALLLIAVPAFAQETPSRLAPGGFREETLYRGVTLWRKGKEYVQVISPHRGAELHLLHGTLVPSEGEGTNFARLDLRDWWEEWSSEEPRAITLANGQFFNMNNPAKSPLAFSTKIDGVVYAGYGDVSEYGGQKMILRIGARHATVEKYDDDAGSLYAFPEDDIIVGLRPEVSKSGSVRRGRTFVGTMRNGNLIVFTSPAATQRYAARILAAFGAERTKIMMLDGGGSSQLIHEGKMVIPVQPKNAPLRTVPLAIGITEAPERL